MMQIQKFLRASVDVLTILVLVACGVVLYRREFRATSSQLETNESVSNWREYANGGSVLVPSNGKVTIVEFSDFQCPFCKRFHETEKELLTAYPNQIKVVFRHFPIASVHPNSTMAAKAAECARAQGRFTIFVDALFAQQDSLGRLDYSEIAAENGVADTVQFSKCITSPSTASRIAVDKQAGERLGVTGTPTILINQHRLAGAPSYTVLDSVVRLALKGR